MRFLDSAKIYIKAGDGGAGTVSLRREKFVEFGGPDGGNGGDGSDVYIKASGNLNTLIDFRYKQHFKAPNGRKGAGKNKQGARGVDLIIEVPVGTLVMDQEKEEVIFDLNQEGQMFLLAKGGIGGKGNAHFKSSTNRTPRYAQPGTEGEEKWIWLELELLADIGLIGLPNAGKSTFITTVTNSKSKVANYAFTTLKPALGILTHHEKNIVLADLPGLIDGASEGIGLGARFLSHIKRCSAFIHLIDASTDIIQSYKTVIKEIGLYNKNLLDKQQIVVLNKVDLLDDKAHNKKLKQLEKISKYPVMSLSILNKTGLEDLLNTIEIIVYPPVAQPVSITGWTPDLK